MIRIDQLKAYLDAMGLNAWVSTVDALIRKRLCDSGHGDFARWKDAVDCVQSGETDKTRSALLDLSPWRKGPFDVAGIHIDSEWRSDLKWSRVCESIAPLQGRRVLDVGCGNGYYALRMAEAGADCVIGIDPTILFVMQFLAISRFTTRDNVFVIPARIEELPLPARKFDTTFSMGVLYHRRSPVDHLRELRDTLRPGGQLVLETIYLPGDGAFARTPEDRYARMRNVWMLPSLDELTIWLARTGFDDINIVDTSVTSIDEQRSTEWMTFDSLREALDPDDPGMTVEGWPAPHRVVITATSK